VKVFRKTTVTPAMREQASADARRIAADPRERALARQIADEFEEMRHNTPWEIPGVPPKGRS
jgi:hypothetical protein